MPRPKGPKSPPRVPLLQSLYCTARSSNVAWPETIMLRNSAATSFRRQTAVVVVRTQKLSDRFLLGARDVVRKTRRCSITISNSVRSKEARVSVPGRRDPLCLMSKCDALTCSARQASERASERASECAKESVHSHTTRQYHTSARRVRFPTQKNERNRTHAPAIVVVVVVVVAVVVFEMGAAKKGEIWFKHPDT
ncbi:hypothetical protein FI667_g2125, partial [Globisporangium splendens]